jgi:hypothetical protein
MVMVYVHLAKLKVGDSFRYDVFAYLDRKRAYEQKENYKELNELHPGTVLVNEVKVVNFKE